MTQTCDVCQKSFPSRGKLAAHKNRKYPCRPNATYDCDVCKKQLKSRQNLAYHKNSRECKAPEKIQVMPVEQINQQAMEKIELLTKEIDILKATVSSSNNKTTVQNISQNINQNINQNITNIVQNNIIVIAPFDSSACFSIENIDAIDLMRNVQEKGTPANISKAYRKFRDTVKKGYQATVEMVKQTHFDEQNPQLHNLLLQNLRHNEMQVFDGKDWKTVSAKNTLETLVYDKTNILIELQELFSAQFLDQHDITMKQQNLTHKYENAISALKNPDEEDRKKLVDSLVQDLKLCCYNNRKMIQRK